MYFYFIPFFFLFFIFFYCFYLQKENYKSLSLNIKKYPFHEYHYLIKYFNLYYQAEKEKIQRKVNHFFSNVSIVFISLERNKERRKNIEYIIKKYNLKNTYILRAIDYLNVKKKGNMYSIYDEKNLYTISPITHEKQKEIACSFSHMKAILFSSKLSTPYTMIIEDDITFDFIPFSKYTIEELYENLPNKNSYLSLYTNKPDYKKDLFEFRYAHFSNGFYGAVSYVMNQNLLEKLYSFFFQEERKFHLPPLPKTLFIADHYLSSIVDNYHLPFSILQPNNLFLESSLHSEKDKDHILLQYDSFSIFYHRSSFLQKIPKILILLFSNPYESWYRRTYPEFRIVKIKKFQDGFQFLKRNGGYFLFSNLEQFILPLEISSLILVSSYFIISIPEHPYLQWIKDFQSFQYEYNQHLRLPLSQKDYKFIEYPVKEKFIFFISSSQNETSVERTIISIINQTVTNWYIYYLSSEKTNESLDRIIRKYKIKNKIKIIQRKEKYPEVYSRYHTLKNIPGEYILVFLDAKDWLYHENVLEKIQNQYRKGTLCTYGKAVFFENGTIQEDKFLPQFPYPKDIIKNNSYRDFKWFNPLLRTCRSFLLKNIPVSNLKDKNGKWLKHSSSMEEWFWIIEQSRGNITFMNEITCVYHEQGNK